jgi:hypothetical protein
LTVGRPGQVREEVLWLRVPKVGSGVVWYPLHLPPPPVIGETRTRLPVPHRPSAEAREQTRGVGETRLDREVPGSRG